MTNEKQPIPVDPQREVPITFNIYDWNEIYEMMRIAATSTGHEEVMSAFLNYGASIRRQIAEAVKD